MEANYDQAGHRVTSLLINLTPFFLLCNLLLCESCQAVAPTHIPAVYLSDSCGEADFQGIRKLTIHSQRETFYNNNVDCILRLSTRSGYVMRFHFEHLDLPTPTGGVCEDDVQIFNGHSDEMHLTRPICGSHRPAVFTSNASNVALRFRTSSKNQRSGFRLRVERWPQTANERVGCLKDQGLDCMVSTVVESGQEAPTQEGSRPVPIYSGKLAYITPIRVIEKDHENNMVSAMKRAKGEIPMDAER
ncbi:hypothetical protein CAPTEDRAFT_226974 [Capitella teleta]|uniref:CUB domain-containing protein n=1 Tax=Capitella teleta TaxID=283909 RepID=R7VFV6_CAPTE|nr:hypothetical protein CAPTEDRAFT_226974 [Capitella teleta]|eukprot:ELU14570.1 hypothetical protein CAPTEDRAFT_226974 [Capitella teleta]